MRRSSSPWPGILALALCLGLITTVAAPRARAQDDQDQSGAKKKVIRVYEKDDDSDSDSDSDQGSSGGYLGVQVQDLTRSLKRAMDLEGVDGALVNQVEDGSPADKAGIRKGDVIVRVGRTDTPDAGELTRTVQNLDAGDKTTVTVVRKGTRKTLDVVLGSRPAGDERYEIRFPNGMRWRQNDNGMPPGMMMFRNQQDLGQQMQDLQDEIQKLTEEIRKLRLELRRSPPGR
jgi:membrane-associated protease RseP (regulator of RpoE activity)